MALQGVRAHADDVVVTTGSQQALDLVTRVFVNPGDVILFEAPSYVGALQAFISSRPTSATSRSTSTAWCPPR